MASRADETAVSDGHPTTADGGTRPRTTCDLAPGDLVGEYRIMEKIGQGGMGVVYGAVHPVIGKRVAIKVLDETRGTQPEAVARFAIEARAVNQIRHPNIVDIFAFGTLADGRSYFAMAWLDGTSLGARLRAGRPPLAETCAILEEVALALEAAHAQRIVHRDLKPDNIYLGPGPEDRPRVTLLDFGIAKLLDDDDEARASLTRSGTMVGTPLYISPEQARCGTIDTRADIYALGAVAYQMVTGSPPFSASSTMEVVAKHLHDPPPRAGQAVPGLPRPLDAVLWRMLAKDPGARPTLPELRAVLAQIRGDADHATAVRRRRQERGLWLGAAAILGLTVSVAGYATRGASTGATLAGAATGAATGAPPAKAVVTLALPPGTVMEMNGTPYPLGADATMTLRAGDHHLRLMAPGYQDAELELHLEPGERRRVAPRLVPLTR